MDCGESVWVCTSVPGNVYYVSQQSSWQSSASVCVSALSCRNLVYVCVCVWTVKQEFWDQERDRRINTLFNGVRRCCIQYTDIHTVMHQCGKVLCSWQQQKTKCRKLKWEVTGHGLHAATETDGLTLLRSVLLCFSFSFFCICHLAQPHYVHACIHANTHTHTLTLACVCFALFLLHI